VITMRCAAWRRGNHNGRGFLFFPHGRFRSRSSSTSSTSLSITSTTAGRRR
jgi:hypothetical protein